MALNAEDGQKMLQLITSRYNDWKWRKKIEKTLSLPQSGVGDEQQQAIFLYLKQHLKAYKSLRSEPDSWIVGGFATKQVIDRVKTAPQVVGAGVGAEQVASIGTDPGADVTEAWWEEMLVSWFDVPEPEPSPEAQGETGDGEAAVAEKEKVAAGGKPKG